MTGVLFPPIDAGSVALYPSIRVGRPKPLNSIPAYGDLRKTGLRHNVIFALHTPLLFPVPALSNTDKVSLTVGALWRYFNIIFSQLGFLCSSPLIPTTNILSLACGTL